MDDTYRWELIDTLKSARLADWLITQPDLNQRTFIDAAKLLEEDADRIKLSQSEAIKTIAKLLTAVVLIVVCFIFFARPCWADDVYADYPIRIQVQGGPVSFADNLQCVGVKGQICENNSYCGWFACRKTDEETK